MALTRMDTKANRALPTQARFLAAVAQLNPEVLQSLKDLSNAQNRPPARRALKQWARRWSLTADWLIDWSAHTIRWQREEPSRRWDRFYHPQWSLRSRFERKPATIDKCSSVESSAVNAIIYAGVGWLVASAFGRRG